jgi:hypothetical protein
MLSLAAGGTLALIPLFALDQYYNAAAFHGVAQDPRPAQ